MEASKARDDLARQLNQKSEECDKLNKGRYTYDFRKMFGFLDPPSSEIYVK